MIIVPDILQHLVRHYGIDAKILSDECQTAQRVRTRTWLAGSTGTSRSVLESLPSAFPAFKGYMDGDILRIEKLKLTNEVMFESGKRISRIKMPWPNLPETVIAALVGRPLNQLLGHPAIGQGVLIKSIETNNDDVIAKMVINLHMPQAPLEEVDTSISKIQNLEIPGLNALIAETHDPLETYPMSQDAVLDTRRWVEEMGRDILHIVGLRLEKPVTVDDMHIEVRFPYSKDVAQEIGRSQIGAWFDRRTYAWQILPTQGALDWLRAFLAKQNIIIAPDGHIHCRKQQDGNASFYDHDKNTTIRQLSSDIKQHRLNRVNSLQS